MRKKRSVIHSVLFVGLNKKLAKALKPDIEKHDYVIYEVSHPSHALKKVQTQEISAVIYLQPDVKMDGHHFVRKCSKLISHPAIIVLTKSRSILNVRGLFQHGAHDCLILPCKTDQLLLSMKRGLERRKARIYGIKDPLTGLFNRYTFKDMLRSELDRAQRYDRHLSLLMIDIDYFKKINDQYGHIMGDRVLVELSEVLKASFRKTDIITRFGGEEFAIILPETTLGHATMLAERIRKQIETNDYSHLIGANHLTVSIGISNYFTPADEHPRKSDIKLIHSADKALYAAKKEGRNKVCIAVPTKPKRATP